MEAFAVATHRHLAEVHPIWALLVPHFEGLLFINNQAATTLIAAGGPIDHIFGGSIASSEKAAATDRLAFDFHGKMPVSYTHLDVYKRQAYDHAGRIQQPSPVQAPPWDALRDLNHAFPISPAR